MSHKDKIPTKSSGIQHVIDATTFSLHGLSATFRNEVAFQQELLLVIIQVPFIFLFEFTLATKLILIMANCLMLIAELANTALETIVDKISPNYDHHAKIAKDIGSAMVLLSLVNLSIMWLLSIAHDQG